MFKVDITQEYKDFIEVNGKKYEFIAYPMDTDTMLLLMEGQKEEDQVKVLKAMINYFNKSIEFNNNKDKKEIRKTLERSGKLFEFINYVLDEMGKQTEEKD